MKKALFITILFFIINLLVLLLLVMNYCYIREIWNSICYENYMINNKVIWSTLIYIWRLLLLSIIVLTFKILFRKFKKSN